MAADAIHHKDSMSFTVNELVGALPTFRTKKAAVDAGSAFGWRSAIKVIRRFETVWIVGKKDFQDGEIAGVPHENYRIPMLRWDEKHGVKYCPVVVVKRYHRAH